MSTEESKMHPEELFEETLYCLFWTSMSCPVREGIAKGTVADKFEKIEVGSSMKAPGPLPPDLLTLMVLAPYCVICPYKKDQDYRYFKTRTPV